jgi:hypothetical protein
MASQPTKLLRRISQPHGLSRLNVAGVLHFADEGLRHALDHLHVLLEVRHHRVPCRKEPQQKQGVRLPAASVHTQSCRWRWHSRSRVSAYPPPLCAHNLAVGGGECAGQPREPRSEGRRHGLRGRPTRVLPTLPLPLFSRRQAFWPGHPMHSDTAVILTQKSGAEKNHSRSRVSAYPPPLCAHC